LHFSQVQRLPPETLRCSMSRRIEVALQALAHCQTKEVTDGPNMQFDQLLQDVEQVRSHGSRVE